MSVRMEELVMRDWVTIFVTANLDLLGKTAPKVWLQLQYQLHTYEVRFSPFRTLEASALTNVYLTLHNKK